MSKGRMDLRKIINKLDDMRVRRGRVKGTLGKLNKKRINSTVNIEVFEMTDLRKVTEGLNKEIKELKERHDNLRELAISNTLDIEALIVLLLGLQDGILDKPLQHHLPPPL
jgi:hypothetical protein